MAHGEPIISLRDYPITRTGSTQPVSYYQDEEQVYPCRCGFTHSGSYSAETFAHHNHNHDEFTLMDDDVLICTGCGAVATLKA